MRRTLIVLIIAILVVAGIVGCARTESPRVTLPATMKVDYVTGTRTPEAVLLEIDWTELGTG